ncbi:MAG: cytochrome c oxidase subunit I [Bacteroidota bacterium]
MSTATAAPAILPKGHEPTHNYLKEPKGIKSWLTTVDHKRIGIMYLFTVTGFFLIGGILALLVRLELIAPGETIMDQDTYNQIFTLHGVVMVFLFIIPSIPASLGNFLLPIMVGAKDVAFPRLNLASFYIYLAGALLAVAGIVFGGVDTGWTFYTPYSLETSAGVLWMTMAVFVAGFSSILTGINFIVTIHKMRAPGLTWNRLPLMIWGLYATSIVQVLATPVIGITMLLLFFERVMGIGIFDPALGGDPVLFQHFFWFYSHPAVYIMILPAFGVISELVTTFSRQNIYGYKPIALSSVAIAFLGFLVWGHHMFVSGQSEVSSIVFSLITYLIGIPSGIKVFNWVATMYKGSVWLRTPMLYALAFLFLFTIGGVTGIMLGVLAVDIHLHDTYYVVAHFHYVMMGGTVIAFIGGVHYWWPKMFGKMYNQLWSTIGAALVFVGFNITFFPQFILGSQGMPRRYHDYSQLANGEPVRQDIIDLFTQLHFMSTVGSWVLALGLFVAFFTLLASLRKGAPLAEGNPWGAATLDWTATTSPPDPHNFHHTPIVTRGPYDYHLLDELYGDGGDSGDGSKLGDGSAAPVVVTPSKDSEV